MQAGGVDEADASDTGQKVPTGWQGVITGMERNAKTEHNRWSYRESMEVGTCTVQLCISWVDESGNRCAGGRLGTGDGEWREHRLLQGTREWQDVTTTGELFITWRRENLAGKMWHRADFVPTINFTFIEMFIMRNHFADFNVFVC